MAKLIFFIHGVAVRNSDYADPLPKLIENALNERHKEVPYMRQIFWGNFLGETDKTWTLIERDFAKQKQKDPNFDQHQSFKYQEVRKGPLSKFIGDTFNYLNTDTGQQIRRTIFNELNQTINMYSDVREVYFVSHSLGTVILWDILFSKRFESGDPASDIRSFLSNRISLQGIVTMGSPIIFINMTLGTTLSDIKSGLSDYTKHSQAIRWLNFLHASDLIAYPLRPLLQEIDTRLIKIEDVYLTRHLNSPEQIIKKFAENSTVQFLIDQMSDLKEAINMLPGIVGTPVAHRSYFEDSSVVRRIATMIHPHDTTEITRNTLERVISYLNQVPGMTNLESEFRQKLSQQLNFTDEVINQFSLRDNCGFLRLTRNLIQVHHVMVIDRSETIQFLGYVGLIHGEGLCNAVKKIQAEFGMR